MTTFGGMAGMFDWTDILRWCEEVGLSKGVVYNDNTGTIEFWEVPLEPHQALIARFHDDFTTQMRTPWVGTPFDPVFKALLGTSKASQYFWY
jgi:hypothetical protein